MTLPRVRVVKVGGSLLSWQPLPQWLPAWLSPRAAAAPAVEILIAGGGTLVDQVRQLDARFALDPETAHWMSVGAMCCTARLVARMLPQSRLVRNWNDLARLVANSDVPCPSQGNANLPGQVVPTAAGAAPPKPETHGAERGVNDRRQADSANPQRRDPLLLVFDVEQWLTEVEPRNAGVRLTRDWRTTSDSIAARLAVALAADELVLLKSTEFALGPVRPRQTAWEAAAEQGLVDALFPQLAPELASIRWVNLRQFDQSSSGGRETPGGD